jgi:hypothetical protein
VVIDWDGTPQGVLDLTGGEAEDAETP